MKDKLELLSILDKFNIEKTPWNGYKISCKERDYDDEDLKDVIAMYDPETGNVDFYMTDLYNNSNDNERINLEQLKELQALINLLKE